MRWGLRISGIALSLLMMVSGCEKEEFPLGEVTGQITYMGVPASAEITFKPQQTDIGAGGSTSSGTTDENGNFRLFFTLDKPGALVGQHDVIIRILRTPLDPEPESFAEATSARKRVELERYVNRGDNRFNFAITP